MKRDPLDQSRDDFVDALIEAATFVPLPETDQRHMEEKGRLLKERCAVELDKKNADDLKPPASTL